MLDHMADSAQASLLQSTNFPRNMVLPIFKTHRHPAYEQTNSTRTTIQQIQHDTVEAFKIKKEIRLLDKFVTQIKQKCEGKLFNIVSIWGPQCSGKSFLLDVLISVQNQKVSRKMSRMQNLGANAYFCQPKSDKQNMIVFLDWIGFTEVLTQIDQNMFSIMYLISSVVIFNRLSNDTQSQANFKYLCTKLPNFINSISIQFGIPKLVLISRDCQKRSSTLQTQINNLELFSPDICQIIMDKPFTSIQKLQDIPQSILNPQFLKPIKCLIPIIYQSNPQTINSIPIYQKIEVLLPLLVQFLNKFNKANIDEIWSCFLELQIVESYNKFVLIYSQQLQEKFIQDDNCCDQLTLMRKLWSIKAKSYSKFRQHNHSNTLFNPEDLLGQRLKQFISSKQKIVIEINNKKSKVKSEKYLAQKLLEYRKNNTKIKAIQIVSSINSANIGVEKNKTIYNLMTGLMGKVIINSSSNLNIPMMSFDDLNSKLDSVNSQIKTNTDRLQKTQNLMRQFGQFVPSVALQQKQQLFKRAVQQTYYMNKAFWQLKKQRQNLQQTERLKVKQYYQQTLSKQSQSVILLKQNNIYPIDRDIRDLKIQISRQQKELNNKQIEIQTLTNMLKKSKKRWLCCF